MAREFCKQAVISWNGTDCPDVGFVKIDLDRKEAEVFDCVSCMLSQSKQHVIFPVQTSRLLKSSKYSRPFSMVNFAASDTRAVEPSHQRMI